MVAQRVRSIRPVIAALLLAVPSGAQPKAPPRSPSSEDLARQADVVLVGTVRELKSEWNASRTQIVTRVTVAVDQYLKGGTAGNSFTLFVPGGEVGTVGEMYSHMPVFRRNEDVVVFAEKDPQNHFRVAGGRAGKLIVKKDPATGSPLVAGRQRLDDFVTSIRNTVEHPQLDR
ncbi:MAG: hypothetical protein AB1428_11960 [Bacteroidota bacterium]